MSSRRIFSLSSAMRRLIITSLTFLAAARDAMECGLMAGDRQSRDPRILATWKQVFFYVLLPRGQASASRRGERFIARPCALSANFIKAWLPRISSLVLILVR